MYRSAQSLQELSPRSKREERWLAGPARRIKSAMDVKAGEHACEDEGCRCLDEWSREMHLWRSAYAESMVTRRPAAT